MSGALHVFGVFLRLGLTSFGGPIAHLGYFRTAFVEKRAWLTEADYAELVALCQFLPGPTSSQVGFAIGLRRAGLLGGLAAFVGFTAPSAAVMIAAAYGLSAFSTPEGQAIAHGLTLVAVAVVAHAVWGMARSLVTTRLTAALAALAFAALLVAASPWLAPALILCAALIASVVSLGQTHPQEPTPAAQTPGAWAQAMYSVALLTGLFVAVALLAPGHDLAAFAQGVAQSGALVFGGGHVVLPLLETATVQPGWVTQEAFLAGYGAAQALPGPLFSFAAFLGAAGFGPAGAAIALVAIFAPGFLLLLAALPLWARFKAFAPARGFVAGANAAVVGVLAAALYDPVFTSAVRAPADLAIAALGFVALTAFKAPAWLVALAVTAAGAAVLLIGA